MFAYNDLTGAERSNPLGMGMYILATVEEQPTGLTEAMQGFSLEVRPLVVPNIKECVPEG